MAKPSVVLEGYSKEEEIMVQNQKKPLTEVHEILWKKRKHSAIRDYPYGCGRFNVKLQQRSHSETCDDRKSSVIGNPIEEEEEEVEEEVVVVEGEEGEEDEEVEEEEDEVEEEEGEEAIFGERKSLMGSEIPCKRRKFYSAIRDYPPGAG